MGRQQSGLHDDRGVLPFCSGAKSVVSHFGQKKKHSPPSTYLSSYVSLYPKYPAHTYLLCFCLFVLRLNHINIPLGFVGLLRQNSRSKVVRSALRRRNAKRKADNGNEDDLMRVLRPQCDLHSPLIIFLLLFPFFVFFFSFSNTAA